MHVSDPESDRSRTTRGSGDRPTRSFDQKAGSWLRPRPKARAPRDQTRGPSAAALDDEEDDFPTPKRPADTNEHDDDAPPSKRAPRPAPSGTSASSSSSSAPAAPPASASSSAGAASSSSAAPASAHQQLRGHGPELPTIGDNASGSEADTDGTQHYDDQLYTESLNLRIAASMEALDMQVPSSEPDPCHFAGVVAPNLDGEPPTPHEEPLEFAVTFPLTRWLDPPITDPSMHLVVRCFASGQREQLIEKTLNVLTAEEARQHEAECKKAMIDELRRWQSLGAFERCPRSQADNLIDARWVLKWKVVAGKRLIKARLTVRGFKDMQAQQLETFSGTTSRWGQRLVVAIAAQRRWSLFSCDVSQAFLRGLRFDDIAKIKGEVRRSVQFSVPSGSVPLLRALDGYSDFDESTEVLRMLRAGFGLKDAPRAWAMVLKSVLEEFGLVACQSDPQLYVKFVDGRFVLVVSTHVDDLKGAGESDQHTALLSHLEQRFGRLTRDTHRFVHVGITHEQSPTTFEVTMHQHEYAKQLRQICLDAVATQSADTPVDAELRGCYSTLLGGAAWMTLTMPMIAVYVSYLQRHLKEPTIQHLRDLNRLVQWVKTHPQSLCFKALVPPLRLVAVSDSSFSAGDTQGLVMRGYILLLAGAEADSTTAPGGRCQVLDWYARKQPHVCRSTFAAELHAALDATGQAVLVQSALTEIAQGPRTAQQLRDAQLAGTLWPPMHLCIDAQSLFDAVAAQNATTPADRTMMVHLLALRELVRDGVVSTIWWIDTLAMLADGLTKGSVPRQALIAVCSRGVWKITGKEPLSHSLVA